MTNILTVTATGLELLNENQWQWPHWVQSKRHRLWFSTKTCSCYPTKTHINSVILILKLNLTSLRNIHKNVCGAQRRPLLMYVSQRSQIKFEDEDHAVNISFH